MQVYPPSPREPIYGSKGSVRMRSGSGTSRTTATSDSGDVHEVAPTQSSRFWSSPSRRPAPLPTATHSAGQPSASSSTSTFGFAPSPISQPNSASLLPNNSNPASALSPIATRMRERDADAMEKYKLRQRSGSATTASTDSPSQNESTSPPPPAPPPKDQDDISALSSLVTQGSVAPRRRLRPSASAAQLRTTPQPLTIPSNQALQEPRSRSGTSPAMLKPLSTASPSATSDPSALPTPTQISTLRPTLGRSGTQPAVPEKDYAYMGPSIEYARFPPPPAVTEEPERVMTPTTATAPTHTARRLPFNILSSHKNSLDQHVPNVNHRRNASVNAVIR
ncbi:hypothetical protein TRAPUB_5154 [Trametes pubescens]|uniref:Uncharacterized protein n=1 Tax=Trametes pubescens TaxID=154538 RepID=A0A1M2V992_TRAPU|nr:hypothetical protein TRAPUB_5154 [Trametes pubescens]